MTEQRAATLKSIYSFFRYRAIYDALLYRYGLTRHQALLEQADRSQCHTYTCFYRSPGQLDALTGPVMEFLLAGREPGRLQINVFASSSGAETYTTASMLLRKFPNLDFHITASDLHQEMVERAAQAVYSAEEVFHDAMPSHFISATFETVGTRYRVRPEIRDRVTFKQANLLDPRLSDQFEPADIVFAQNVLFHLDRASARQAFDNIIGFLKQKSALFIDGMELDMREALTAAAKLSPLDYKCRDIHEHARKHVGKRWWNYYYGMEPYAASHPTRARRFSTIFLKGRLAVKRFSSWDEAAPYRDEWNDLVIASASRGDAQAVPSIFQTFDWNQAWWQTFGESNELLLLGAFDGPKLAGAAALMIERKKFPMPSKVLRFIGSSNFASDYCGFASAAGRADVAHALIGWLESNPRLWDELEFTNMPENSADLALLRKRLSKPPFKSELEYFCDAPTRILGNADSDQDLVNRKSLKRHFNWFKNQGELTFGHRESSDEISMSLDGFFEQHIGRRSITATESQFKDARQKEFYRELVKRFAPRGWLKFFSVELDGKPIAYHFGFEFGKKLYWYKPSFAIEYIKKSPGEVLLKTLFEYAIERQLKEFDFTAGNEAFKYRFANQVRKLYLFRAFRAWPRYALYRAEIQARTALRRARGGFRRKTSEADSESD